MNEHKKDEKQTKQQVEEKVQTPDNETVTQEKATDMADAEEEKEEPSAEDKLAQALQQVQDLEDKNLRMMAEFDNYRRRTNKEKLDLISTAGEGIFKEMLPLIDDFERAIDAMQQTDDINSLRSGIELIYSKFIKFLDKQNVHPISTEGVDFSTDEHEAITTFAAGEENKGKIIDCTQKGYKLGDKVIRYAKVVVGE